MNSEAAVAAVIEALNAESIRFMLVGSMSSNVYGIPRSTQDADFVLEVDAGRLQNQRGRLGGLFLWQEQMLFETVTSISGP